MRLLTSIKFFAAYHKFISLIIFNIHVHFSSFEISSNRIESMTMFLFNETNTTPIFQPVYHQRPIHFSIPLILMIISIPCFIFLLYHLLTKRALFSELNNHVIICLVTVNAMQTVTDLLITLIYFYTGFLWPLSVHLCMCWHFLDYYFFTTCFLFLTWASIERHILIFHRSFYTRSIKNRLIGHYIPLGFCCSYPLIYYIVFMFFYPCKNFYNVNSGRCAIPCFVRVSYFMALYEQIVHGIALMFIILFLNLAFIIRVYRQNKRMGRQSMWIRNRKIILQLLGVCLFFFLTNGGYFIIQIGVLLGYPDFGETAVPWLSPLSLCMPPLVPFMCSNSLPDLKEKLRRLLRRRSPTIVTPLHHTLMQNNQPDT